MGACAANGPVAAKCTLILSIQVIHSLQSVSQTTQDLVDGHFSHVKQYTTFSVVQV